MRAHREDVTTPAAAATPVSASRVGKTTLCEAMSDASDASPDAAPPAVPPPVQRQAAAGASSLHQLAVMAELGVAVPAAVASRLGRRALDRYDAAALHVWADHDQVVLTEWIDPPCASTVAELLAQLGPADREAAGRYLRAGVTTTEHVYAARGLALTVAASYDQPPRFAPSLATVQLFTPGTLRDFVLELGGNDQLGPRMIGPGPR